MPHAAQLHPVSAVLLLFNPHVGLTEDGEDLTCPRSLEQVAYEHIRGDVGKMHLKPSHRDFLDERLRLRVEGEPRKDEHLVTVHLRRRDCLLHLVGNHRSVLGTKADGNAERIAILLRFRFGVQVAQVERADVLQLQPLAAGEENAALLFEEVDHRGQVISTTIREVEFQVIHAA
jgi:hypothetical protein